MPAATITYTAMTTAIPPAVLAIRLQMRTESAAASVAASVRWVASWGRRIGAALPPCALHLHVNQPVAHQAIDSLQLGRAMNMAPLIVIFVMVLIVMVAGNKLTTGHPVCLRYHTPL